MSTGTPGKAGGQPLGCDGTAMPVATPARGPGPCAVTAAGGTVPRGVW